jgi:predicted Zn-dependent protease
MNIRTFLIETICLILSSVLTACSVNPVTGDQQLLLPSQAEDRRIGQSQYIPAQQSQGGAYTLDSKLSSYISQVGQKLAAVSDSPDLPYEFVVLNNSVPNAWALPGGKIAINRGLLLELQDEAQLAAVLGHEIVHAAARHGAEQMRNQQLLQLGLAGLGLAMQENDYRNLVIGGAALGAQLTSAKYGRGNELESDEFGMKYMAKAGYELQAAVELQELFLKLSGQNQSSWLQGLFASHPPSAERVKANIVHAGKFASGPGYRGKEAYQQATQYLRSKAPAYELADKAAQALAQKQLNEAEKLITEALKIEAKEAQFHSLKGQILQAQGKSEQALAAHDQAQKLNPALFSTYLHRAQSFLALGRNDKAQADLQTSMEILPTSLAAFRLGQLFEAKGQLEQAEHYFQLSGAPPKQ